MGEIEEVCKRHNVKEPEQIISEIEAFDIEFNESDLLDSLSKINSYEDRIIFLQELVELTKPDWESEIKPHAVIALHDLSNQYILDYQKLQHEENKKQLIDSKTSPDSQEIKMPHPKKVAENYYAETNSKNRQYEPSEIAPVMKQTQKYLEDHPELKTVLGHIKTIIGYCNHLEGGRDAKSNWIKFYAFKAGKFPLHKLARTQKRTKHN